MKPETRVCIGDYPNNKFEDIDGQCETCGNHTVKGEAYVSCAWGEKPCEECGYQECNDGC